MSSYTPPAEKLRLASDANTSLGRVVGEVDVDVLIPYEIQKLFGSLSESQRLTQTGLALLARALQKSQAHRPAGNCDVVNDCAKQLGVSTGEVIRMMDTAV